MSNYAIIKVGSSQEKISIGDKLSVPKDYIITDVVPILVSSSKGEIVSDTKVLDRYKIEFEQLKESKTKKINIFQYKNKTGNRRKMGYREETKILLVKNILGLESAEEE